MPTCDVQLLVYAYIFFSFYIYVHKPMAKLLKK